jgi:hypothetical protein
MGMFDYVRCELPLPDGWGADGSYVELQTKDFEFPYLETYTITKGGRLTRRFVSDWEPVPESEWEYVGDDNPLHKLWHERSKRKPIHSERDVNFHGMLNFYGSEGTRWHEYNAKFTDGQLVSIEAATDEG